MASEGVTAMQDMNVAIGASIDDIDTPALIVDLDAFEHNLRHMAAFTRAAGIRLRPHAKTHKCPDVAKRQIALGAVGMCCQKVSEAEAMVDGGVSDVLVSNEIVGASKLARLAELSRRAKIGVCVDNAENVRQLKGDLDVYIEIDVGMRRCGVAPGAPAVALAREIVKSGLRFGGLQAYHGRAQHLRGVEARAAAIRHAAMLVRAAQASITSAGMRCPLVTGAGSGSFAFEAASGVYDELQCGSYLFMDRDYADNEATPNAPVFEHALFVKSQVMSRGASHAVVDAGHKAHAVDSGLPRVWQRELVFANGGDEHGILTPRVAGGTLPGLGETVWLVPGHCDPTVNLHDHYVALRGGLAQGNVEAVWTIDARGRLR